MFLEHTKHPCQNHNNVRVPRSTRLVCTSVSSSYGGTAILLPELDILRVKQSLQNLPFRMGSFATAAAPFPEKSPPVSGFLAASDLAQTFHMCPKPVLSTSHNSCSKLLSKNAGSTSPRATFWVGRSLVDPAFVGFKNISFTASCAASGLLEHVHQARAALQSIQS